MVTDFWKNKFLEEKKNPFWKQKFESLKDKSIIVGQSVKLAQAELIVMHDTFELRKANFERVYQHFYELLTKKKEELYVEEQNEK